MNISAQVSLYPLGVQELSPTINEVLQIFYQHHLDIAPGPMSTLIIGPNQTIFAALQESFQRAAEKGRVVMVVTFSNACPIPDQDQ